MVFLMVDLIQYCLDGRSDFCLLLVAVPMAVQKAVRKSVLMVVLLESVQLFFPVMIDALRVAGYYDVGGYFVVNPRNNLID